MSRKREPKKNSWVAQEGGDWYVLYRSPPKERPYYVLPEPVLWMAVTGLRKYKGLDSEQSFQKALGMSKNQAHSCALRLKARPGYEVVVAQKDEAERLFVQQELSC